MKVPFIGMEVEANWPTEHSSPTFFKVLKDNKLSQETWRVVSGTVKDHEHNTANLWSHTTLKDFPKEYLYVDGWSRGQDCSAGMEFRFDGPVDSVKKAENRIDHLVEWMDLLEIKNFRNAGTHIHLGLIQWLREEFNVRANSVKYQRLNDLLSGFFATREAAILQLMPARRQSNQFCRRYFDSIRKEIGYETIDNKTPSWAVHNLVLNSGWRTDVSGLMSIAFERHFPTYEFRMFPGTKNKYALYGYLRLVIEMLKVANELLADEGNWTSRRSTSAKAELIVNPYKFSATDLQNEISDPWVKKWIEDALDTKGSLSDDGSDLNIMSAPFPWVQPQRIATSS